jgi:HPt (histidine-containing phosphotransfer) domain-containing protein
MREAVYAADAESLMVVAHGLLGVSSNLGLRHMAKLCGKLQSMSRSGSLDNALAEIQLIEQELVHVKPILESQCDAGISAGSANG